MNIAHASLIGSLTLTLLVVPACSREDRQGPVTSPPVATKPESTPISQPTAFAPKDETMGALTMSDGEIVKTTDVIDTKAREEADYAALHATDPAVRQFAQMMIDDHTKALSDIKSTIERDALTEKDSDLSRTIEQKTKTTLDDLKSKKGADFDKAYMDARIKEAQDALDTLDQKLIPASKAPEVRNLLTAMRATVEMHLDHAKMIRKDLR